MVFKSEKSKRNLKKYLLFVFILGLIITSSSYLFFLPSFLIGKNIYIFNDITLYTSEVLTNEDSIYFYDISKNNFFENKIKSTIYFTKSKFYFIMFAGLRYDALAVTNQISNKIFIRPCSIKEKIVYNPNTKRKRDLQSIILHESTHIFLNKKFGKLSNLLTHKWKIEGYCEYVAKESSMPFEEGIEIFLSNKNVNDLVYDYFKYKLYVSYLIDVKKIPIDEILTQNIDINNLDIEIKKFYK